MKGKLGSPSHHNHRLRITFTAADFRNMKTNQEKSEYLAQNLINFINFYHSLNPKTPQKHIHHANLELRDFSEILAENYSILLPQNIYYLFEVISIIYQQLGSIPNASLLLPLYDIVLSDDRLDLNEFIQMSFSALFLNDDFSINFIGSSKFIDSIFAISRLESIEKIDLFLSFFLLENFVEKLSTKFQVTEFFQKFSTLKIDDLQKITSFLNFFSELILKWQVFNPNILKELDEDNFFEKINDFFIHRENIHFMDFFYEKLLSCPLQDNKNDPLTSSNSSFDHKEQQNELNHLILKKINILYHHESINEEHKCRILQVFFTKNDSYFQFFTDSDKFQLTDWLLEETIVSSMLFGALTTFLTKCACYKPSSLFSFIKKFLVLLLPPINNKVLYNDAFSWMISMNSLIEKTQLDGIMFDSRFFIETLVIKPEIRDASFYFNNFPAFRRLFLALSHEYQKEELFTRILELMDENMDNPVLQDFFMQEFRSLFGEQLLLYFFKHVSEASVQILLMYFSQETTDYFVKLIKSSGSIFDVIEQEISKNDNYIPILRVFNILVNHTNDHFFDEYIISLPKESLFFDLFKVINDTNFETIENLILPHSHDFPIPIPSLVPLISRYKKLNFKFQYNYYLLGVYALPIYNLLNEQPSNIVNLNEVFLQYIRFEDFVYVYENDPKTASQLASIPNDQFNIYEAFPGEKPAYLSIDIVSLYLVFKIKFESRSRFPTHLFLVNGETSVIFVQDDHLFNHQNQPIANIQLSQWYGFSFYWNRNNNRVSVFLEGKEIYTFFVKENFKIDYIGSPSTPPSIHYSVMNTVAAGLTMENPVFSEEFASDKMIPHGNMFFVYYNSFYRMLCSKYTFTKLFRMVEKNISKINQTSKVNDRNEGKNENKIINRFTRLVNSEKTLKITAIISLMCNSFQLADISSDWFYCRFRYCLMGTVKNCQPFYMTSLLHAILATKNEKNRTIFFSSFIHDYLMWSMFPENILSQCLDFINDFIVDASKVLDIKILEENNTILYCLTLIYVFRNSYLVNGLMRMLKTTCLSISEKALTHLFDFAFISHFYDLKTDLLFDFEKKQPIGNKIISLALEVAEERSLIAFNIEELLGFALLLDQQLAVRFTMKVLNYCDSEQFVYQHFSLLCRIVSRFPLNNQIWQKLFQLITDDKNFYLGSSNINNYPNLKLHFLPLILSAFVQLCHEESIFSNNIRAIVRVILINNVDSLISKSYFNLFSTFLSGKFYKNVPKSVINQKISQNTQYSQFYPIFVDNIDHAFYQIVPKSFTAFAANIVVQMLIDRNIKIKKFSLILNAAVHSSTSLLGEMLLIFSNQASKIELSNQHLALINDASLYYVFNEEDPKKINELSDNLFSFCLISKDRFISFLQFYIFSYQYVNDDAKVRYLDAFQLIYGNQLPKTINDMIPLLQIIFCYDMFSENKFVQNIFKHFIINFKNTNDENLSLVIQYSSLNDLIESKDFQLLKDYLDAKFVKMLEEAKTKLKFTEVKGNSKPVDNLGIFLFNHQLDVMQRAKKFNLNISQDMNTYLRLFEKHYSSFMFRDKEIDSQNLTFDELVNNTKSNHISPFYSPGFCPLTLIPSSFQPVEETNDVSLDNQTNINLFGFEKRDDFRIENIQRKNLAMFNKYGGYFTSLNSLESFIALFGAPIQVVNCRLIRRFIDIPIVLFRYPNRYMLLSNCVIERNEIQFINFEENHNTGEHYHSHDHNRASYYNFLEQVENNEFGKYYLFCSHPVIPVALNSIIISHLCTDDSVVWSVGIYSTTVGSFILSFPDQTNIHMLGHYFSTQKEITEQWINGRISNLEYLTHVNLLSGRSFDDISSYPIIPRVLREFSSQTILEDIQTHLRNFELPIAALADNDPDHETLKMRYEMQRYHNCENISNGAVVSSFLIRIPPFLNYSIKFHSGFDSIDRIFTSIESACSIRRFSTCELLPELFSMPEILENESNKIEFPEGVNGNVDLPKWSNNSSNNFIQLHRMALENVRSELSGWIDLVYGFKQTGAEAVNAFNLYNPLSYQTKISKPVLKQMRADFVKNSGQMPQKIFNSPHPSFSLKNIKDLSFDQMNIHMNSSDIEFANINKNNGTIVIRIGNKVMKKFDTNCFGAIHCSLSGRGMFLSITYRFSIVKVFRIKFSDDKITQQITLSRKNLKFSYINDRQQICASVCKDEVVLWSLINGMIIKILPIKNINCVKFDDELNFIYFGQENTVLQYSINGDFLHKIECDCKVTSLAIGGFGFSFEKRFVVVGKSNGKIAIFSQNIQSLEFDLIKEFEISKYPIVSIVTRQNSEVIEAVDSMSYFS